MRLVVHEPPVAIHEPEPAIALDAGKADVHLFRIHERERLHRRDRYADDPALHMGNASRFLGRVS